MGDPLKTAPHVPNKYFAAPDSSIVAISGAVEADTNDAFVPRAALGEDRRHMRAMMLHGTPACRRQRQRMQRRCVLRMTIVRDHQVIPCNVVHGDQVFDRLLKCPEAW